MTLFYSKEKWLIYSLRETNIPLLMHSGLTTTSATNKQLFNFHEMDSDPIQKVERMKYFS